MQDQARMSLPALYVQIIQDSHFQRATKLYTLQLHIPATATVTYDGACQPPFAKYLACLLLSGPTQ